MAHRHRARLVYPHPWKLRVASLALSLKWLAGITAIVSLAFGISSDRRSFQIVSLAALGAFVVFTAVSTALASELPCKVCRHPALNAKGCRKHERARAFLGLSHPLTVALSVLLTNRFRCFYCGERIPVTASRPSHRDDASAEQAPAKPTAAPRPEQLPAPVTDRSGGGATDLPQPATAEASQLPGRR